MLTGIISGNNASLRTGDSVYADADEFRIKNIQFAEAGSVIPCADSGDTNNGKPHVPGKKKTTSGSFDHIARYGETKLSKNTQYEAHIIDEDTLNEEVYYSGPIIITNLNHSTDIEGDTVVIDNYSFTVDENLTAVDHSGITILGVTNNTGTVTVEVDNLETIDADSSVTITEVAGMTDLNGTFDVDSINAGNNTFVVTLVTIQTYTSGGKVEIN
jgi:hypothetical protein